MPRSPFPALLLVWTTLFWPAAHAQVVTGTDPVEGLRDVPPRVHALVNARLVIAPGQTVERGTLVVRDGRILAAGADVTPPPEARTWDLTGKTVYAGFIDGYSHFALPENLQPKPPRPPRPAGGGGRRAAAPISVETPATSIGGSGSWNPLVSPQRQAAEAVGADEKGAEKIRALGFTAALVVPGRGVFRGESALVALNGKNGNRALLRAPTAQHVAFEQTGFRDATYPGSLMGSIALIRQTLLDAGWYGQARAYAARHPGVGERLEDNAALGALSPVLAGRESVVFDTEDELDSLRAARIAEEFHLKPLVLRGNGYEYRVLDALKKTNPTLILPLAFPETPEIEMPGKALDVSLAELEHWNEAPANPGRVARAGIPFVLTTAKLDKPDKQFWPRLREAVKRGLSETDALAALTTGPARLFGVADRLGTLEKGKAANFVVTSGNPFTDDKASVLAAWIDGEPFETEAGRRPDARGTYAFTADITPGVEFQLSIEGEAASPKASIKLPPQGKPENVPVSVRGEELLLLPTEKMLSLPPGENIVRLTTTLSSAGLTAGVLSGSGQLADGKVFRWSARRTAAFVPPPKSEEDRKKATLAERPPVDIPDAYPAGAFGVRKDGPAAPDRVLIRHATVWTSGPQGKLENADLMVAGGKIQAVGRFEAELRAGTKVIDATGMHVTPGLIDCHSHTAIAGGVNEATHAVTCEVRIGDVVDATDIGIYRELAGGLTCANLLHGSANPIGGQNQIIKLRWGSLPEDLKFAGAKPGVKFALGENVKQSNWGERFTIRYPQTRMGVEEIMRDRFLAAREYGGREHSAPDGPPVRRDLQLEALAEMLHGERNIHIHSYRQDEILMFIRLAEQFGLTVAAFQHGLECYKVADEIARLGAGVSAFSDWWNYKVEVTDGILFNGAILQRAGVLVSFNSDSNELARRLNTEAAKAVRYGGLSEEEALRFVTINPARQLRIDQQTGSLEPGKDADFVLWTGHPLSSLSRCEQTWIDGRCYFDHAGDAQAQTEVTARREALIQRALPERQRALGKPPGADGDKDVSPPEGPAGTPTDFDRLLLHGAIHHARERQGLYHNGEDRHNCSTADW